MTQKKLSCHNVSRHCYGLACRKIWVIHLVLQQARSQPLWPQKPRGLDVRLSSPPSTQKGLDPRPPQTPCRTPFCPRRCCPRLAPNSSTSCRLEAKLEIDSSCSMCSLGRPVTCSSRIAVWSWTWKWRGCRWEGGSCNRPCELDRFCHPVACLGRPYKFRNISLPKSSIWIIIARIETIHLYF